MFCPEMFSEADHISCPLSQCSLCIFWRGVLSPTHWTLSIVVIVSTSIYNTCDYVYISITSELLFDLRLMSGTVMEEAVKSIRDLKSECMNSNPGFVTSKLTKLVTLSLLEFLHLENGVKPFRLLYILYEQIKYLNYKLG